MAISANPKKVRKKKSDPSGRKKCCLNYLSASVSVSLLDPVVVSWLERDGRADELRLPPPGPPPPPSVVAAIPVWLLVPVDEEVDAFFLLLLFPVMVTTPTLRALFAPA